MIYEAKHNLEFDKIDFIQSGSSALMVKVHFMELEKLFVSTKSRYINGDFVQREIKWARAGAFADYIVRRVLIALEKFRNGDKSASAKYIVPPIIATPDFTNVDEWDLQDMHDSKTLKVSKGWRLIVNDGQHRIEGLKIAVARLREMKLTREERRLADIGNDSLMVFKRIRKNEGSK